MISPLVKTQLNSKHELSNFSNKTVNKVNKFKKEMETYLNEEDVGFLENISNFDLMLFDDFEDENKFFNFDFVFILEKCYQVLSDEQNLKFLFFCYETFRMQLCLILKNSQFIILKDDSQSNNY